MSYHQVRYNPFCLQEGLFFIHPPESFVEFGRLCVEKNAQANALFVAF